MLLCVTADDEMLSYKTTEDYHVTTALSKLWRPLDPKILGNGEASITLIDT